MRRPLARPKAKSNKTRQVNKIFIVEQQPIFSRHSFIHHQCCIRHHRRRLLVLVVVVVEWNDFRNRFLSFFFISRPLKQAKNLPDPFAASWTRFLPSKEPYKYEPIIAVPRSSSARSVIRVPNGYSIFYLESSGPSWTPMICWSQQMALGALSNRKKTFDIGPNAAAATAAIWHNLCWVFIYFAAFNWIVATAEISLSLCLIIQELRQKGAQIDPNREARMQTKE